MSANPVINRLERSIRTATAIVPWLFRQRHSLRELDSVAVERLSSHLLRDLGFASRSIGDDGEKP